MRILNRTILTTIVVLGLGADGLAKQIEQADGAAVYATNCARCHEDSLPRMPSRDALRERSARQIQTAMTSGVMRPFGSGLTAQERRAVAEFLAGEPAGTLDAPLLGLPDSAYCSSPIETTVDLSIPAWNGW